MATRRIFICYRREDTSGHAGRLYDRLNQQFPDEVFRDADKIQVLNRWELIIEDTLRSCEVAVVLIGRRWLDRGTGGSRRLDDPDDPVRKEIEALLRLEIAVIPVLIDGAALPARESLPPQVAAITAWQALKVDDDDFDHDVGRLVQALRAKLTADDAARTTNPHSESTATRAIPNVPPTARPEPASTRPVPAAAMRESWREALARYQKDWDEGGPFLFGIEDVFDIAGRGLVVTGHVKRGRLKMRDEVEIVGIRATRHATAAGLEFSRKLVDEVIVGDECGVLLAGIEKSELIRGRVLALPGSVQAHQTCTLTAYMLSKEEGGWSRAIRAGEEVQFHLHAVDVAGTISAKDGAELRPGAEAEVTVHLSVPMALVKGLIVPIRRGKVSIGVGSVLHIGS